MTYINGLLDRFIFVTLCKIMKLKIKKLRVDAILPTRAHHDDAGADLYSCGDWEIAPGTRVVIPTGVALQIEDGYVGLIWDKSGIGAKGLKSLGGVLDAGYRGEIFVTLHNLSDVPYLFSHGHKIAQLLIQKVEFPELEEVTELDNSKRGDKGFGSTGA